MHLTVVITDESHPPSAVVYIYKVEGKVHVEENIAMQKIGIGYGILSILFWVLSIMN